MGEIKVNPENYEDMVEKLKRNERKRKREVLESAGVSTEEEFAKKIASEVLPESQKRAGVDRKELKTRVVKRDPDSPEIKRLREELVSKFAQEKLLTPPASGKSASLKGRVGSS